MAAKKTAMKPRKPAKKAASTVTESQFALVLEDLRAQFGVFGEALQGFREEANERFGRVEDAIKTHSEELRRIEGKVDTVLADHEERITKLEGRQRTRFRRSTSAQCPRPR